MFKNVLITGSSDGIGAKIAEVFAQNSFNVFICGRNTEKLQKLAAKIGAKGFYSIDLTENLKTTSSVGFSLLRICLVRSIFLVAAAVVIWQCFP